MMNMQRSGWWRISAACLAAVAAWPLLSGGGPARAAQMPVPAYPLHLSPDRIAAFLSAARQRLNYLPGEVLVRFREGTPVDGQTRALASLGSQSPVWALRWSGSVAVVRGAPSADPHALAAELRAQPDVAWAEPNYLRRPRRLVPNDPGYDEFQWNLRTIDMPRVWDINPGGTDEIIVAVIDTGVTSATETVEARTWNGTANQPFELRYSTNPDLTVSRLVNPADLVFWDGPVVDFEGHGTHVAGTIGQDANNDFAQAGIAYGVRIMPIKACLSFWDFQFALAELGVPGPVPTDIGGCPDDAVADAIRLAADSGAHVINLSLGGFGASEAMREALLYAVAQGVFVAIAAGNSFEDGNPIEHPAAYAAEIDGVMSVGAVGPNRSRAFYSGTASGVEIAAPGGDTREGGIAGAIWQHTILFFDSVPGQVLFPRFDRYADTPSQGTSMATPHVAGVAALLISQGVTSPAAVEALLKATALDLGAPGPDADYGYGLIQPRTAIRGYGIFTR